MFILLPEDEPVSPMLMNWKSNAKFKNNVLLSGIYKRIQENLITHVIRGDNVFLMDLPSTSVADSVEKVVAYAAENELKLKSPEPVMSNSKYDVFILFKREKQVREDDALATTFSKKLRF